MLVLHAIVMRKPAFGSKAEAISKAREMFPQERLKGFVRETKQSFRVRVVPKTKFVKTSFRTKVINPEISLVFGVPLNP
jgi:hypothetical protein